MCCAGLGTITMCLRIRHFRSFPQIDLDLSNCHRIVPQHTGVGPFPESLDEQWLVGPKPAFVGVSSLRGEMSATRRAIPAEAELEESATDLREAAAVPHVGAAKPQLSSTALQIVAAAQPVVIELPRRPALR